MNPGQSLELLKRYYDAFNQERDADLLALLSDDVAHDVNQAGREVGRSMFTAFLQRMRTCYREQITDTAFCVSQDGTRAAVEYVVVGSYLKADEGLPAAHGQDYRLAGGAFFELAHGKITRVTNYYNLQDWLQQVQ